MIKKAHREKFEQIISEMMGRGGRFLRIHRVRQAMGLAYEEFDRLLDEYAASQVLELCNGDPGSLSEAQYHDSYHPKTGIRIPFIYIFWHGGNA